MEEIRIIVNKTEFKKAIKAQSRFSLKGKNVEGSPLSTIKFSIEQGFLILSSTDGFEALQTQLEIISGENDIEEYEFYLSSEQCSKLVFIKTKFLDEIKILKHGENVEFYDEEYSTSQILKIKDFKNFPDIGRLFNDKNKFKIAISQKLLKDITLLTTSKGYIEMLLNPDDSSEKIQCFSTTKYSTQRACIVPINLNEEQDLNEEVK
jgi:hypothetical protein